MSTQKHNLVLKLGISAGYLCNHVIYLPVRSEISLYLGFDLHLFSAPEQSLHAAVWFLRDIDLGHRGLTGTIILCT